MPVRPSTGAALLLASTLSAWPASAEELGAYAHFQAGAALGRGLRLNNPYRLATPLGERSDGLSLSATYADYFVAAALGGANGWQHGGAFGLSSALQGVAQQVITPSYLLLRRVARATWLSGRAGVPIVLGPDTTWGIEGAVGASRLLTGTLGFSAELVGSVFYGAAVQDRAVTAIPIVSLELGLVADWELLP